MKREEWIKRCLAENKLLVDIPLSWSEEERAATRREVLEMISGIDLSALETDSEVLEKAKGRSIEQAVGVVSVPLGIAGPLIIKGSIAKGKYFVPLATTEGALVASINRGCKAISLSGGVVAHVDDVGITRAPVFRVSGIKQALKLLDWINRSRKKFNKIAEETSDHLELLDITAKLVGKSLFVRFVFDSGEAMGMNMATIATDRIVKFMEKEKKVKCISLTGNFCVDKKPSGINFLYGRGKQVWAEVKIRSSILKKVLKTDNEKLVEVGQRKLMLGSAISGSLAFNAQYANVVAGIFLATGQDVAHVVEASLGITTVEKDGESAYFSVFLPDLVLGTVGGGTHLPTQKAALGILGLGSGESGEAKKFAEIVAGAVLAGEISLIASLAEGSLASAHQSLGRGENM